MLVLFFNQLHVLVTKYKEWWSYIYIWEMSGCLGNNNCDIYTTLFGLNSGRCFLLITTFRLYLTCRGHTRPRWYNSYTLKTKAFQDIKGFRICQFLCKWLTVAMEKEFTNTWWILCTKHKLIQSSCSECSNRLSSHSLHVLCIFARSRVSDKSYFHIFLQSWCSH